MTAFCQILNSLLHWTAIEIKRLPWVKFKKIQMSDKSSWPSLSNKAESCRRLHIKIHFEWAGSGYTSKVFPCTLSNASFLLCCRALYLCHRAGADPHQAGAVHAGGARPARRQMDNWWNCPVLGALHGPAPGRALSEKIEDRASWWNCCGLWG